MFVFFTATPLPTNSSLSDRFARIVADLCRVIAVRSARHPELQPLMLMLWSRLRRMEARFQALVARIRAGLPSPASRPTALPAASRPHAARPAAASPRRFPQGFAWLVRLMQESAVYGSQLQYLLADPEMPALLAAEPRLGRMLRPLLHMLAVRPGPELALPPRRAPTPCGAMPNRSKPKPPKPRPPQRRGFSAVLLSGLSAASPKRA